MPSFPNYSRWTSFVQKKSGTTLLTNKTKAAGIGVDTADSNRLKYNAGGTVKTIATDQSLTEVVITTNVITASESGKVFFLDLAGGFVSTLPAVAAGLKFKFIVKTAPTTAYTVVGASGTPIKGHVLTNDVNSATDSDFGTAGELTVTFAANKAVAGDQCEFECDGTNWFVSAKCSVFDAITIS